MILKVNNRMTKLKRDFASNIWGLRGIIQLLLNLIKLYNCDLIALNEFVKNVVVYSQINNLNAPLSDFVSLTEIALWLFEFKI